jgi:ubiquitin C-terminal hydrolase
MNNIEECLKYFCEAEEVNDYKCDNCNTISVALKKLSIFELPSKLIIQLKRFSNSNNSNNFGRLRMRLMMGGGKINDFIQCPINSLDLSNFQNDIKPINQKYNLYATVNHSGSLNGGHYIAKCKNFLDKKWYEFNDSTVSYIDDENSIIDNTTYILFYEKA